MEKQKIVLRLSDIAGLIGGEVSGENALISGVCVPEDQKDGFICMINIPEKTHLMNGAAAAYILTDKITITPAKPFIRIKDARAALVKLMIAFHPVEPCTHNISAFSAVPDSVEYTRPIEIGNFASIGERVVIGANTRIYPHCVIGDDVKIGKNCIIYPNVTIYENCTIGDNVIIHAGAVIGADGFGFIPGENPVKIPQKGTVILEDFVELGANTCVDRATIGATVVGFGTKVDDLVMIGHNNRIGHACLIASQVGFSGSSNIGDRVVVGGQVGFSDHINIVSDTIFGGQTGVPNDVKEKGAYLGAPCIPMLQFAKAAAVFKDLPELKKRLIQLEKKSSEK